MKPIDVNPPKVDTVDLSVAPAALRKPGASSFFSLRVRWRWVIGVALVAAIVMVLVLSGIGAVDFFNAELLN